MKSAVYNTKGKQVSELKLPSDVFEIGWNPDLVHHAVVAMQSNARANTAHAKERDERRGGGKKPWRQKGTGRARHGSIRSPLWRKGGVTFGPRTDRNYGKKVNKKARRKAFLTALAQKQRDGEVVFVDAFDFDEAKTKHAREALTSLAAVEGLEDLARPDINAALILVTEVTETLRRSFSNINTVELKAFSDANVLDLMRFKHVVMVEPDKCIEALEEKVKHISAPSARQLRS